MAFIDLKRSRSPTFMHSNPPLTSCPVYVRTLTTQDISECLELEEKSFMPEDRLTQEKLNYILTKASELSLGIFTITFISPPPVRPFNLPRTVAPYFETFIGYIAATKTNSHYVTPLTLSPAPSSSDPNALVGHNESGHTIAIHTLCIDEEWRGKYVGSTLVKEFLQRMAGGGCAKDVSVRVREPAVGFWERFGFGVLQVERGDRGEKAWWDLGRGLGRIAVQD
ncbi:hypothetical protein RUND412_009572 [Rhizina undulata]